MGNRNILTQEEHLNSILETVWGEALDAKHVVEKEGWNSGAYCRMKKYHFDDAKIKIHLTGLMTPVWERMSAILRRYPAKITPEHWKSILDCVAGAYKASSIRHIHNIEYIDQADIELLEEMASDMLCLVKEVKRLKMIIWEIDPGRDV